jgi:hypothetical protein
MEIFPDKRQLIGLVEQAYEGKICLPNFQRDFVWTREEVADLMRSIIRGYFIGSLLLLRCETSNPPFAPEFLRGAKQQARGPEPSHLILDGQQRITSLIYALTAPNLSLKDSSQRRFFFVNLDKLLAEPDSDDIIFDRAKRELRGLDEAEEQYAQRMLPCTALFTQQAFYRWRDGFEDWLRSTEPDLLSRYRDEWRDGWTSAVTSFQTFQAPLVELPSVNDSDSDSIGRVCAIFEKLNSTGVELSVYDLLTARLYRSGIRLHDLWNESCASHQRLRSWSKGKADEHKFGVLVLRTLALLRGLDPKPRILIDLSPVGFEDDWRRAAAAMERALELIKHTGPDGFGVFDEKWLPGFGLIPILAALRAEIEDHKLGHAERQDLRHWYWCNVFMERYSSSVESKSRKDYQEMTGHWLDGKDKPEVFQEARNWIGAPSFRIRSSASYASSVYSGVFCLLALHHARDWHHGEEITLQELNDHHIFPRAYLQRHNITRRVDVNSITNRTLISDGTNQRIKAKAPAVYCADPLVFTPGLTSALLEPHFIDGPSADAMRVATDELSDADALVIYNAFRDAREAAIIGAIRDACGITSIDADDSTDSDEVAADVQADVDLSEEEALEYQRAGT